MPLEDQAISFKYIDGAKFKDDPAECRNCGGRVFIAHEILLFNRQEIEHILECAQCGLNPTARHAPISPEDSR